MLGFIARRLAQSIAVLVVMSALVFLAIHAVGNPIELYVRGDADQQEKERATAVLGLDRPLAEQYTRFLANAVRGDLGNSFVFNRPAFEVILERLPATFELAIIAMLIAIVLGVPLGMIAGLRPDHGLSRLILTGSILGYSLPAFWVGLMLIMIFAVSLGWLPASGRGATVSVFGIPLSFLTWDGIAHLILPAINLAIFKLALVTRLACAGMIEERGADYVRYARAKGLPMRRILTGHVLKNILIPIVTVLGLEFGSLIAFAVVTETVFSWPGMGKLLIDSIRVLDRPVVVAYLLLTVTLFILINLAVDVLYSMLDPRVRIESAPT